MTIIGMQVTAYIFSIMLLHSKEGAATPVADGACAVGSVPVQP